MKIQLVESQQKFLKWVYSTLMLDIYSNEDTKYILSKILQNGTYTISDKETLNEIHKQYINQYNDIAREREILLSDINRSTTFNTKIKYLNDLFEKHDYDLITKNAIVMEMAELKTIEEIDRYYKRLL